MNLDAGRPVHFVGIGGAGMSAIAKVLLERGVQVTGSDLKQSRGTSMLGALGAVVTIGHSAAAVPGNAVVVVSSAIPDSNPEVARARAMSLPIITRGEALASVLHGRRSIVVAGTHGKTTTTSMIVTILRTSGLDPTFLVGGELNDSGTNAHNGTDDTAVAESDESDGSFLLLRPSVAVVTNVEPDHLDYWGSFDAIKRGFGDFMARINEGGALIVPATDADVLSMAQAAGRRIVAFDGKGDVYATEVHHDSLGTSFVLVAGGKRTSVTLSVPGRHNVANALAAAAASIAVGVSIETVAAGLRAYGGVERRFQLRGTVAGVTVIDDYAHHPTEVEAILAAARAGPWDRLVAVFQPHRYSRTSVLSDEFGRAFADADRVVVTDVYGAGEQPVPGVTGKLVSDAVGASLHGRPVAYLPHRAELISYLTAQVRPGDAVLTLGAGDVTSVGAELIARLEARAQ
jgi:UDP-N-acetylmuramate--alanine ligase